MKTLKLAALLLAVIFLNACSDDDEPQAPKGNYEKGYFVTNEGPFQNGTGTITFIGEDEKVEQNIYKTVNGEDLGNIVQSMTLGGDNAYIVVNNSNKIVVANRYTMKKIAVITGDKIKNPRILVVNGDTAYLSNWGDVNNDTDDFISVIDLKTNTVTSMIAVGEGPENMLIENDKLFVTLEGGWNQNNKVEVIDIHTNTVIKSIIVGDVPNSIIADESGDIWVLCGGNPSYSGNETSGSLCKISNLEVEFINFEDTQHPAHLTGENNKLYYNLNGKVYQTNITATELPTDAITGLEGFYYTMQVNNGVLYTTDAKDYASEGALKEFNVNSGDNLFTAITGIIPGSIVFQ